MATSKAELDALRRNKFRGPGKTSSEKLLRDLGGRGAPPWDQIEGSGIQASESSLDQVRVDVPYAAFTWKKKDEPKVAGQRTLNDYLAVPSRRTEEGTRVLASVSHPVDGGPIAPLELAARLDPKPVRRRWIIVADSPVWRSTLSVIRGVKVAPTCPLSQRLADDLRQDLATSSRLRAVTRWPGVVAAAWYLPLPKFTAPIDLELLAHGWDRGLAELRDPGVTLQNSVTLYLRLLCSVCLLRDADSSRAPKTPDEVVRVLSERRQGEDHYQTRSSLRWQAFVDLRRSLQVFAWKEFGLPDDVREKIRGHAGQVDGAHSEQVLRRRLRGPTRS